MHHRANSSAMHARAQQPDAKQEPCLSLYIVPYSSITTTVDGVHVPGREEHFFIFSSHHDLIYAQQ